MVRVASFGSFLSAVLVWAVFCAGISVSGAALGNEKLEDLEALTPRLQKGGYVIYFRHGMTDQQQVDAQPVLLEDCSSQRNLSQEGREQARVIGAGFRARGIPVGEVLASPFCRCRETAQIAFGRASIRNFLYFGLGMGRLRRSEATKRLEKTLATPPEPGKNTIIVSHTSNLKEAADLWPKPEGAAFVFEPDSQGGFKAIGKITPGQWAVTP